MTSKSDPVVNFDGRRMHVSQTAEGGVVNEETFFDFKHENGVVSARYAGGGVQLGHLIGKIVGGKLEFRYAQVQTDGVLDGGRSICDIECLPTGKLRLLEHFQWESREGSGTNIFDEI